MSKTYEQLHEMYTRDLADHHLEAYDSGPVSAWYLKRDGDGRMMSTLIVFTPEGIVIMGDYCPGGHGIISAYGYGLKWFVGQLSPDYLAEKFLPKAYHEDDAEEWFRYELEQVDKAIDPPFDNQYDLDDANLLVRREALQAILDGGEFHECAVMDEWQSIAVDCDDSPSYTYDRGDKALLSAIQQRFAAQFAALYLIEHGREHGNEQLYLVRLKGVDRG